MTKFCKKKYDNCIILNALQRVFCSTKKYTKKIHRHAICHTHNLIYYAHTHKHRFLMWIHLGLLLLVITFYNVATFNKADDVTIVQDTPAIVIENEPEMLVTSDEEPEDRDQGPGESDQETDTSSDLSGDVSDLSGDVEDEEIDIGDEEIDDEEVITGSVSSGMVISGAIEYFSGMVAELSGEVLYNTSGDVVGEMHIESGAIVPTDLSGTSLFPQELSVIYPTQSLILNVSGYIQLDRLFSVTTTGGAHGANYCSRIALENISAILKAGVWTWRETNEFVLQGDADQLVTQGLENKTMIEVTSGQLQEIFSGENGTGYGFVYDVYNSFMNIETKVYHRITVVYADDPAASDGAGGQRYVLDPLRGARTTAPQTFAEYFTYYDDEVDVQRYIGQAYIPSVIIKKFFSAESIRQLLRNVLDDKIEEPGTGEQEPGTGEIFTGQTQTGVVEVTTGEVLPEEIILENTGTIVAPSTPGGDSMETIEEVPGAIEIAPDNQTEEIVVGYFTKAYTRGDYSEKIIELQKLLSWLQMYTGALDGVYTDAVMAAVYQYQLANAILTPQDPVNLRGYLGPSTRMAINASYTQFQIYTITQLIGTPRSSCEKIDIECRKQELEDTLVSNGYVLTNKGLVQMSKDALVGSETLDMNQIRGNIIMPLVLQSKNTLSGKRAEVQIPQGTLVMDRQGKPFLGEITVPVFLSTENVDSQSTQDIIAVIDVGTEEKIQFKDESGNKLFATFRIPAPGMNQGDSVDVFYSQDGEDRNHLTNVEVQLIDGEPYAIFEADHFTQFYLGTELGSFTINNDDAYTTGLSVTLTSSVSGATHMRFGNSIAERDAASRVVYNANYSRTLTGAGGDESKRVYAQFSGNGVIRNVSDSIIYDTSSEQMFSNLRIHIDGTSDGSNFYDQGPFGYDTSSYGQIISTTYQEEPVIQTRVDGYIDITTGTVLGEYPYTISAWIMPTRLSANQAIVIYGDSINRNVFDGIMLRSDNKFSVTTRLGGTQRHAIGSATVSANARYHVVGVFNDNRNRQIYVNGVLQSTNTQNAGSTRPTSPQVRIGRYNQTSSPTYFSGMIDEVRIYSGALSSEDIQNLYMIPPTFDSQTTFTGTPTLYGTLPEKIKQIDVVINNVTYPTTGDGPGKWMTLPILTGIVNGTHNVTLHYTNIYGRSDMVTYPNAVTIAMSGVYVMYDPSTPTSGNVVATLTGIHPEYMVTNNFGSEFFTFTGNDTFVREYVDKQGTTGTTTANVTWIDREAPSIIGVESGATYTGEIIVDFADNVLFSGAVISGINVEYYMTNVQSGTIELDGGIYEMTAYDAAGNATSLIFTMVPNLKQKINKGLINKGYKTGAQALVPVNSDVFVGSGDIDLDLFEGELLYPIVIQSVDRVGGFLGEVAFPAGVKVKDSNGNKKTGILRAPRFKNPQAYQNALGKLGISAIDVGGDESMKFENSSGDAEYVTFRMPVPGREVGELIDIYFSEDNGTSFVFGMSTPVREINGDPYVIFVADHFTVVVTAANGGTNISADNAINSTYSGIRTTLSNITIAEGANNDFAVGTNVTLILTVPSNWTFNPGVGQGSYTANRNITAGSLSITSNTITLTLTIGRTNKLDSVTLSGIQVRPVDGKLLPSSGNIMRLSSNPGTMSIVGLINDVTNFGTLSQIPGIPRNLLMTLSGQTFQATTGNVGLPVDQYAGEQFVISSITAIDQYINVATSYSGSKTLSYTGATGTVAYTTGVTFVAGQSTTTLNTTIYQVQAGIRLTATDGVVTGLQSSLFNVLLVPQSELIFSATGLYENSGLNNGSISETIVMTLSTGEFSPYVISSGYIQIQNLPTGLTGNYVLSGTDTVIFSLTGTALNHYAANSTGIYISFLSGAFVDMVPEEVTNAVNKYITITFYDPAGYIAGQQLRLKGNLSGTQFFDSSPNDRLTTGYNSIANSLRSTETVMGPFNGTNQYIDVGTYTLANYTMSARFYSNTVAGGYRSIIARNGAGTDFEISLYNDRILLYSNGNLQSTTTLQANKRYHVAVVKDTVGTKLYLNGSLDTSNTYIGGLTASALAVGRWNTSQYRTGLIDEVQLFDSVLTGGQVYSLYMKDPSYIPRTTLVARPDIRGLAPDPQMTMSLVISGMMYPVTNNQDGTREALHLGPFSAGTYDVQLNYTNVYGRTGMLYYTGGLTVDPQIYIIYDPPTLTSGDVVATVTGYQGRIVNNGGSPSYTFTGNGQFTFELENSSGDTATITAVVDWIQKASISYSNTTFYENQMLNNGSIANTIVATITGDTFASNIVTNNLVQLTGTIPIGLTPYYTLSGNSQLIIGLTGNAVSHTSGANTSGLIVNFLNGAFTTYSPSEIGGSYQTGINIEFYDGALIGGQQIRLKGARSGTQFFDSSPNSRLTTGMNGIGNSTRSGETVMGLFDGVDDYIDIGSYTLTNYTVSIWLHSTNNDANRRSAIGSNNPAASQLEIVKNTTNFLEFYGHGRLTSTFAIESGVWYHVVLKQTSTGTQMFIDGQYNTGSASRVELAAAPLAVGADNYYGDDWQGYLDEAQIFDSPLTEQQIDELYMRRPNYTGKTVYTSTSTLTGTMPDPLMRSWVTISGVTYTGTNNQDGTRTVSDIGPLSSGTYDVQLDYMNVYGKTGTALYTGGLIVNLTVTGSLSISGPVSFDFQERDVSDNIQTIEVFFTGANDYFQIIDEIGADTGYYTTIEISDMINSSGDSIPYTAIAIRAFDNIITLEGTSNPRIYSAITGVYQYFFSPLTFIKRDTEANGGVTGTYGLHTVRKVDIPALQNVGDYTGVITYTLY